MEKTAYMVSGMSCVSCAARIEKAVNTLIGVTRAVVNFPTEELTVDFDSSTTSEGVIEREVQKLGYAIKRKAGIRNDDNVKGSSERIWLIISFVLSLPIMLTMGVHHIEIVAWSNLLLATIVQFTAGFTFYRGSWYALKGRTANMDVLVALGTSAAYFYSVLVYFGLLGASSSEVFFETSAMLIAFVRLGKYLEARARGKAGEALTKLLRLQADKARLVTDDGEREVFTSAVRAGDLLLVRAGETIPTDGEIVEGSTTVDESMVTGESVPCEKQAGDMVIGSTINRSGVVKVRATRVGEETVLSQIVKMVREALADKAPIQRFADRISAVFVPVVLVLGLATFGVWYVVLDQPFIVAFKFAIAVVVIACPCAMGLATPTAIMVGSGIGLSRGILIKRGSVLENISKLSTIVLDKTGTITEGKPSLTDIVTVPSVAETEFLQILASAESQSSHPLAQAALEGAKARGATLLSVVDAQEKSGFGIICTISGMKILAGNARLMADAGISVAPIAAQAESLATQGKSLVYLAADNNVLGVAALADRLKPSTAAAIDEMRRLGLKTLMITGDNEAVAAAIARQLNLDEFEAEVLPERKRDVVKGLQAKGEVVAMVGDGINDAPALALADVGIAIGSGTDVAKETGDVILVRNDLLDVIRSIRLGRATLNKIKQNLFWALFYNIVGIPIAAGILYFPFGVTLKPEMAGLAMVLSSVSVVLNSILLRRVNQRL